MISFTDMNQMDKEVFIEKVGWVFEHSPWIAEKAWEGSPFPSLEVLFQTMVTIVQNAEKSQQLVLLRAHPDLGTRLKISEASQKEQAGAGLDKLSKAEFEEFVSLNQKYTEKFSFPFILAVKGHTKDTILNRLRERLDFTYEEELDTALHEVYKIARFRLNEMIQ